MEMISVRIKHQEERRMGSCTSYCRAIFLSLRDWLLFLVPCAVALAADAFIATGAIFVLGGLLWSLSIPLIRKRNSSQRNSRGSDTGSDRRWSTKFELLTTATDPTDPISKGCQNKPTKFSSDSEKHGRTESAERTSGVQPVYH